MIIIEETERYYLEKYDNRDDVRIVMKDESKRLLSDFVSDFEQICELIEEMKKIEAGDRERYGFDMDWYSFSLDAEKIRICSGGEARYAKIIFDETYSFTELKEMLNIYCDKYQELYHVDLRIPDDNYWPLEEGIIEDYPTKQEVMNNRRFK